jgi:hypothetical protein
VEVRWVKVRWNADGGRMRWREVYGTMNCQGGNAFVRRAWKSVFQMRRKGARMRFSNASFNLKESGVAERGTCDGDHMGKWRSTVQVVFIGLVCVRCC